MAGRLLTSFIHLHTQEYFRKVLSGPLVAVVKATSLEPKSGGGIEVQGVVDGFTDIIDPIFNSDSQCPVYVESNYIFLLSIIK